MIWSLIGSSCCRCTGERNVIVEGILKEFRGTGEWVVLGHSGNFCGSVSDIPVWYSLFCGILIVDQICEVGCVVAL